MMKMKPDTARQICFLIAMALDQEAEMKARSIPVPKHMQLDKAELSKLIRRIGSWVEEEFKLPPIVSELLEGEAAIANLQRE